MDERFDDKIKEALKQGTDNTVQQKQEVWQAIKSQTTKYNVKGMSRMDRKKRKNKFSAIVTTGTVAAALLLTFLVGTQPGKAAIDKIKELFEPKKDIVQDIEGMQEKTNVELASSKMGYILYVDKEYYDVINEDDKDKIVAKNQGEGLPRVFMEITQVEDKSPEVVAQEIENEIKSDYPIVENRGQASEPIEGILLHAATGQKWNDTVVKYYLVDNTKGGTFVIKQQYFVEAAEGHGARFYHILKEFKIVEQ